MKKLSLVLSLMCFHSMVWASYGLSSPWREVKERVTLDFELETDLELDKWRIFLEDYLGQELLVSTSSNNHYKRFQNADGSFSQCLPALSCGQYECMMDSYKCDEKSFLPNFPVRVCKGFEDDINLGRYDEDGILWVYQTTYCLQKKAMIGLLDPSKNDRNRCDIIEEQIVDLHEECFFDQQKSLCELSFDNKKAVFKTLLPHGSRFVTKNNRIDWHRVKVLWDHAVRCSWGIASHSPHCAPVIPGECQDDACLQQFADSLNCLLK